MKLRYISMAMLLIALGTSCKKQLEQAPTNAIPVENAFKTVSDFEAAAKGMYYQMVHTENYLAGEDAPIAWASTLDVLADNVISQQTGRGSQRTFGNWQYNRSNTTNMFAQGYTIVRSANAILENLDNISGTPASNNFEGEALTVRAMVHFDLLRVFSKPVSGPQADLNSFGVPYVTTTDLSDRPSRGTVKETYTQIIADLTKAVDLINDDNGVGRLNKASVYALLSRVYLYGGEWSKCIEASTACLGISDDPGSITAFPDIWTDATEDGVIFKIRITEQDKNVERQPVKIGVGYSQQQANGDIKSEWVCAYSLFKMYGENDVRTAAYIITASSSGSEYNAVAKYLGRNDGTPPGILDLKYLRVAEVLLNRAEAYDRAGDGPSALADLDHLRENRYTDFAPGSETGAALTEAIAKERRLEMAFEGDRWFELKRKGLPVERDEFGDLADGTGAPYFARTLLATDFRWQIPLPNSDVLGNTNLDQNPGY